MTEADGCWQVHSCLSCQNVHRTWWLTLHAVTTNTLFQTRDLQHLVDTLRQLVSTCVHNVLRCFLCLCSEGAFGQSFTAQIVICCGDRTIMFWLFSANMWNNYVVLTQQDLYLLLLLPLVFVHGTVSCVLCYLWLRFRNCPCQGENLTTVIYTGHDL